MMCMQPGQGLQVLNYRPHGVYSGALQQGGLEIWLIYLVANHCGQQQRCARVHRCVAFFCIVLRACLPQPLPPLLPFLVPAGAPILSPTNTIPGFLTLVGVVPAKGVVASKASTAASSLPSLLYGAQEVGTASCCPSLLPC